MEIFLNQISSIYKYLIENPSSDILWKDRQVLISLIICFVVVETTRLAVYCTYYYIMSNVTFVNKLQYCLTSFKEHSWGVTGLFRKLSGWDSGWNLEPVPQIESSIKMLFYYTVYGWGIVAFWSLNIHITVQIQLIKKKNFQ